jgi:hypothetical protein
VARTFTSAPPMRHCRRGLLDCQLDLPGARANPGLVEELDVMTNSAADGVAVELALVYELGELHGRGEVVGHRGRGRRLIGRRA